MLCALSLRTLKPGSYDYFRRAWEPEDWPEGFTRAYHLRSLEDENQVISFGFYEGTMDELNAIRDRQNEDARQQRMAEFVESTLVDGMFEVLDEVTPPSA
jgi:hypothetical protein